MTAVQFIPFISGLILLGTPCLCTTTTTGTPTRKMTVTLPETTSVTTWHLPLSVTSGDNQQMTCTVTGDAKAKEYFTVIPRTCLLTLAKSLDTDPDKSVKYDVFIKYYNESVPSDVSYTSATVLVSRNQYGPVFTPARYSATVTDSAALGTSLVTVSASDNDIFAPNNMIFYSLSNASFQANGFFSVHPMTGVLTVNRRLSADPSQANLYTILVVASDLSCSPRSSTATVMVTVSRNTPPKFTDKIYTAFVSELAKVLEERILKVSAVDTDSASSLNGQLTYNIRNPEANRIFEINSTTGAITPRVELRRVTPKNWVFEVEVSDAGVPPLSDVADVSVMIQVAGFPFFTPNEYDVTIPEDYVLNTTVVTVTARDPVSTSVLLYDLRGDGVGPSFFSVEQHTGDVRIITPLRNDTRKSTLYTLRVAVFRQSDIYSTAEAIVKITVIRNPTAPAFSQLSQNALFVIPENQALYVGFANISATDNDIGESGVVDYSVSPFGSVPTSALSYFYINPHTGSIIVTSSLLSDPSTSQYILTVIARDRGTPSRSAATRVTIRVTRNPNAPVFQNSTYTVTLPESAPDGYKVVDVTATDDDGDSVVYAILHEPSDSYFFSISQSTGEVRLQRSISRDLQTIYNFKITATDSSPSPKTATVVVSVDVVRNPNTPVFSSHPDTVNISEYTPLMDTVLTVSASDADDPNTQSGQIRYSVSNVIPPTASHYFIVGPTSGTINLVLQLNNARSPDSTQLSITASDRYFVPKTATTQVTVNVVRNMYAPVFDSTNLTVNINETVRVGEVIAVVNATDDDALEPLNRLTPNSAIKYRIITSDDRASRVLGVSDDGKIFVKQPFYNNGKGNLTLTAVVRAEDSGWNQLHSDLPLTVNVIQKSTVSAVCTGVVGLGFIQPVYILTLRENTPTGELLTLQVANQQNNPVRCVFIDGNRDFPKQFSLMTDEDNKNCILYLSQSLDRETIDRYHLMVRVEPTNTRVKRASAQIYNTWRDAEIVLNVVDVNDNAPRFRYPMYPVSSHSGYAQDTYYTAISASAKPTDIVSMITATDADEGPNGQIVYVVNNTDERSFPFSVSPSDGIVSTTLEFTPSSPRQYRFHVTATDSSVSQPALKTRTKFIVNLIEEHNRFVLELRNRSSDKIIPMTESLRRIIQEELGYLTLIERIQARRFMSNQQSVSIDLGSTDVMFVLVGNETLFQNRLVDNSEQNLLDRITSDYTQARLKIRINRELKVLYGGVRLPFQYNSHVNASTDTQTTQTSSESHDPPIGCGFPKISGTGRCSYTLMCFLSSAIIVLIMIL